MAKSPEEHPQKVFGWAARDSSGSLSPFHFSRRENADGDVTIEVLYCGVCHSDLHSVKNEWGITNFPIVPGLPPDSGAPLLCAGITVYSPMKYYGMIEPGKHLGVAGLGGLGHIAVKIGKAFGLKVTVIRTSPSKEEEAINTLGADSFVVSTDPAQLKAVMGTMDYIIDTVSAVHAPAPLIGLLKLNGKLITVGLPDKPLELPIFPLVLDFRYRFVIDVGNSLSQ
ncbi:hypothetical protein ACLB2K_004239 [Fragaria x ananassa]